MLPSYTNLTRLKQYLKRFPGKDQPAAFEYLVGSTFNQIFYLPFQSKDNEDNSVSHRVIWYGSIDRKRKTISCSPSGPDSICFAYGYYILIETTLRGDVANQWRREFVESLKHCDDFIKNKKVDNKDVYLILIAPKLHKDTYVGYQQKAKEGRSIIILESASLVRIGNALRIISAVRHIDIRQLLNDIIKIFRDSTSLKEFRYDLNRSISNWQKDILKAGKSLFIGFRAYKVMCQINRTNISVGEIYRRLLKDSIVREFFKVIDNKLSILDIEKSIIDHGFAIIVGHTIKDDEPLFESVHSIDFKAKEERLIKEVEKIYG
jgi:hypothetical protein